MKLLEDKCKKSNKRSHIFIISKEPSKADVTKHDFWKKLSGFSQFKLISPEESEIVAETIENTEAKTFLS